MAKQGKYSRRELCRLGATAVASGGLMGRSVLARPAANQHDKSSITNSRRPRNIIFMISDGMSAGVPSMAKPFSYLVRGKGTNWSQLASKKQTVQGLTETHSLDSLVTDSAAASSCWATGCRVPNGSINVLPDGTKLTPIMRLAHDAGLGTGLVTTTQITHATPAGFASVQRHRGDQHLIAQQYKGLVDVLLGGGREYFDPARRKDGLDLAGAFQADQTCLADIRQRASTPLPHPPAPFLYFQYRPSRPRWMEAVHCQENSLVPARENCSVFLRSHLFLQPSAAPVSHLPAPRLHHSVGPSA